MSIADDLERLADMVMLKDDKLGKYSARDMGRFLGYEPSANRIQQIVRTGKAPEAFCRRVQELKLIGLYDLYRLRRERLGY